MAEPLTDDELDGLRKIHRIAFLLDPEIAPQVLGNALGAALDEIDRARAQDEDLIVCCPNPDCGHWAASHYTGTNVKTGCALCPCPFNTRTAQLVAQDHRRGNSRPEIASSVGEG